MAISSGQLANRRTGRTSKPATLWDSAIQFNVHVGSDWRRSAMRAAVVAVASVIVSGFLSVPALAHADACVNGTVKRGGSGGDYFLCQVLVSGRCLVACCADVRPELGRERR